MRKIKGDKVLIKSTKFFIVIITNYRGGKSWIVLKKVNQEKWIEDLF